MALSDKEKAFLAEHRSAAMITIGDGGMPKAVRVGIVQVDGQLWSSGTADRVRTERLRKDPRCTLFVFSDGYAALTLETTVTILDGPDAPQLSLKLFRAMQNRPTGPLSWFGSEFEESAFVEHMAKEGRLVYQFEITKSYGLF